MLQRRRDTLRSESEHEREHVYSRIVNACALRLRRRARPGCRASSNDELYSSRLRTLNSLLFKLKWPNSISVDYSRGAQVRNVFGIIPWFEHEVSRYTDAAQECMRCYRDKHISCKALLLC